MWRAMNTSIALNDDDTNNTKNNQYRSAGSFAVVVIRIEEITLKIKINNHNNIIITFYL